jgi:hypothetical protein
MTRFTPSASHRIVRAVDIYHLALAATMLGLRRAPAVAEQLVLLDENVRPADLEE